MQSEWKSRSKSLGVAAGIVAATLLAAVTTKLFGNPPTDFVYLHIGCDIFSIEGKLIFKGKGAICDFAPDGSYVTDEPKIYDKDDREAAASADHVHHMIKYTGDQKNVLSVEAEAVEFNGEKVKSDCFAERDLKLRVTKRWCLSEHLSELRRLGFEFRPEKVDYSSSTKPLPGLEISHANTIYKISENSRGRNDAAFSPGNYLVNIMGSSGAMLILDKNMKEVMWFKNLNRFEWPFSGDVAIRMPTHDSQLMPDGRILSYATVKLVGPRTQIIKWDPTSVKNKVEIIYEEPEPKQESTAIGGQVTALQNGNYFFTENMSDRSQILIVDPKGKVLWKFPHPGYSAGALPKFLNAKPLYNTGFLRARGLL